MKPIHIIIIGFLVLAGPPVILGAVIGHFYGAIEGIGAGVLLFALDLAIAHKIVARRMKRQETPKDE